MHGASHQTGDLFISSLKVNLYMLIIVSIYIKNFNRMKTLHHGGIPFLPTGLEQCLFNRVCHHADQCHFSQGKSQSAVWSQ